jgi:hypothetical protein
VVTPSVEEYQKIFRERTLSQLDNHDQKMVRYQQLVVVKNEGRDDSETVNEIKKLNRLIQRQNRRPIKVENTVVIEPPTKWKIT